MKFICEYCNKEFEREKYKANRSKHKYCSKECSNKAKNKKIEKICIVCGKKYFVKPNRAEKTKTCSIKCRAKLYRKNSKNPNQIIIKENYAEIVINSKTHGTQIALIDIEDVEKCKKYNWIVKQDKKMITPYIATKYRKNLQSNKRTYLSLHRLITNCPNNMVVDHINHNTLDNRKSNLRICTQFENTKNNKNNKSGYVGVYWIEKIHKWVAKIHLKNNSNHIGCYDTFEEAVNARKQKELEILKHNKFQ